MADRKIAYGTSSNITVTSLHSLAASTTWMTGWESNVIDNTSNKYLDYLITGKLTSYSANRQAGTVMVYVIAMLDDSTYYDMLDGSESNAGSWAATAMRDGVAKLGAAVAFSSTASEVAGFAFNVANLFGGMCPAKFSIWIAGNIATTTNVQLASSGNQVTIKGSYETIV